MCTFLNKKITIKPQLSLVVELDVIASPTDILGRQHTCRSAVTEQQYTSDRLGLGSTASPLQSRADNVAALASRPRDLIVIGSDSFVIHGEPTRDHSRLIWSKAPVIVGAHNAGLLIRSSDGFWPVIPTDIAGKSLRGGHFTPDELGAAPGCACALSIAGAVPTGRGGCGAQPV